MRTEAALALPGPPLPAAAGLDIGLLLRLLRRRLPLILLLAALGGAIGFGAQKLITPRYTSTVSLLLEPKRTDSFGADTTFGSMYVDEAKIASVVSVITSSDLLAHVVRQLHLDDEPDFGVPLRSLPQRARERLIGAAAPAPSDGPEARFARAMWRLSHAIMVERVGFTYVVMIAANAGSAELAQRIAGAVADAYLGDQVDRKVAATQRDATWLTARLEAVRHDLELSETAVDAVRRRYGLLQTALGQGATLDQQAMTELNEQLIRAEGQVADLRARADESARNGSLDTEASPLVQTLRARQAEDEKEIAALGTSFGPGYPALRRLQEGQRTLRQQIDVAVGRVAQARRAEYETALSRTQALHAQLNQAIAANGSHASDEGHQRLREAERVADENRGLYQALLTKWRDLRQQQTREEPEGRIISAADVPDRPSFPKPLLFPFGAAVVFLLAGVAATVLPALADRRFATADAVEQRLGLPVLGAIPVLAKRERRGAAAGPLAFTAQQTWSRFAESLRIVRAVLRVSPDGPATVLQVTSAASGEGKSTVAAALAASAARAGIPTVLVDADLRAGGASKLSGLAHAPGLADWLAGTAPGPAASLLRRRTDMPLAVLGAGTGLPARPELLEAGPFAALLAELAAEWQLVVVDTPPVLPVSDALVISRAVQATVLVVAWRGTTRRVAEQAMGRLRSVGAPLAGVLLNRVDVAEMARYDGGDAAAYAYGYGAAPSRPRRLG